MSDEPQCDIIKTLQEESKAAELLPILTPSEIRDKLKKLAPIAVLSLQRTLLDPNARDADKINAAKLILQYGYPDMDNIQEGIENAITINWTENCQHESNR